MRGKPVNRWPNSPAIQAMAMVKGHARLVRTVGRSGMQSPRKGEANGFVNTTSRRRAHDWVRQGGAACLDINICSAGVRARTNRRDTGRKRALSLVTLLARMAGLCPAGLPSGPSAADPLTRQPRVDVFPNMSAQPHIQPQARPPIRLTAQLLTCVIFCILAALIIFVAQDDPLSVLSGPMGIGQQLLFGLGLSALAAVGSYVSFRLTAQSEATHKTIAAYSRLDLSGLNPVWVSLAAGIGEELLFRAALQPLLGVWITSIVFLLTHTPVYQFRKLDRATLVQAAGVFVVSVALGFIYQYVGLLAAVLVHVAVDVVGLYVVRNALRAKG
ncbi:MAG TPA: hypothetical protein DCX52_01135 [Massilia sp.]|nr:hypothetical protein [Massilia sp.]